MVSWELWFAIIPGLILFLYGIEQFSREIQRVAGERFRSALERMTRNRWGGAALGALVTAIIQSSTATTVIVVGLVNAGTLSFAHSLGVMFGANVGTTVTAQLVAFGLTGFAPIFILLGFLLSLVGGRYRFLGKPIFYFGLVFFSLSLISDAIEPIKSDPEVLALFSQFSNVLLALLAGIIFTILIQSSSVTTGVVVLLAGSGLLTLGQGIPIILGANIGTTLTSLLASLRMGLYAKRAAAAHILFNMGGALLFLPFLGPFGDLVAGLGGNAAQQVANAHLIFNLTCAVVFIAALQPFKKVVERLVPGEEEEILFRADFLGEKVPESTPRAFSLVEKELVHALDVNISLFDESVRVMKDGRDARLNRVVKLEAFTDFLNQRIEKALRGISSRKLSKEEAHRVVFLVRASNVIEQIGDKGEDLAYFAMDMAGQGLSFSPESVIELEEIYAKLRDNMELAKGALTGLPKKDERLMKRNDSSLRALINSSYEKHLQRLAAQKAYAGSFFVEALAALEASNAKVREIRKVSAVYRKE